MQVEHRSREDLVAELCAAVPPGLAELSPQQVDALPATGVIDSVRQNDVQHAGAVCSLFVHLVDHDE